VKPFQKVLETGKLTSRPFGQSRPRCGDQSLDRHRHVHWACTGTPTKNAIAEAVTQLKQIYG
jgi:hypothetical protein